MGCAGGGVRSTPPERGIKTSCEARLPRFLYDYISGGSYQENALRANIAELEELRVAMILTGCSDVNRATPDLLLKD